MITAIMLPNLTKTGILINFIVNQDFIAEVFCINRAKPESTCNGNCYLSDQIKKAQKQEDKQAPTDKKDRLQLILYWTKNSFNLLAVATHDVSKINTEYENKFYNSLFTIKIFHPPKLSLI